MADLIDREELLCALYQDCRCMNTRFLNCVRQACAVKAEPVMHGYWIPEFCGDYYKCSVCGKVEESAGFDGEMYYNFCPHCGAKMG